MKRQDEAARPSMETLRELHEKLREALAADPVNENLVGGSRRLRSSEAVEHEGGSGADRSLDEDRG